MSWITTQRSFVNVWECDENEHLNMQHYFSRFSDAATHFFVSKGHGLDLLSPTCCAAT